MTNKKNSGRWLFIKEWQPDCFNQELPKLLDKYERWRRVAKIFKLSKLARLRLEWIIYNREGCSVKETANHFGIVRKTFYK